MTALLVLGGIAMLVAMAAILLGRVSRKWRLLILLCTAMGVVGYGTQSHWNLPGAPKVQPARNTGFGEKLDSDALRFADRFGPQGKYLMLAEGFARQENYADAAGTLLAGIKQFPNSVDLWVAYGNMLVSHAGGRIPPAARLAFARAEKLDPAHPAPPFFLGTALAQDGDLNGAAAIWQQMLDRGPANAPWRAEIESRVATIRAMQRDETKGSATARPNMGD